MSLGCCARIGFRPFAFSGQLVCTIGAGSALPLGVGAPAGEGKNISVDFLEDGYRIDGEMSEGRLEMVVLGLSGAGRLLLEAASQSEGFRLQAVADRDGNLAERLGGEYGCAAYDDYRQLITAADARLGSVERCLLVGASMHSCEEYVRLAIRKGFNVVLAAPGARHFEEAAELVRLAEEEGVRLAVANPRRFAGSFAAVREYLREGRIEDVFLVAAFCSFAGRQRPRWQSDPKLAGGGVLLHWGYSIVDQILWNFPLPEQVYSLVTNEAADRQQRLSLTEDTAVVAMKFSDRLLGNLIVSGRSSVWPRQEFVKVCGKDRILVVNDNRLTVRDGQGQVCQEFEYEDDPVGCARRMLDDFRLAVLQPGHKELCTSGRENLKNIAFIESAYLSARTGMPEEPGRILQMGQLEPSDVEDIR